MDSGARAGRSEEEESARVEEETHAALRLGRSAFSRPLLAISNWACRMIGMPVSFHPAMVD